MSWLDALKAGDVVRFGPGRFRTVLSVYHRGGKLAGAAFPILHCSWTKRGYTVLSRADLNIRAKGLAPARIDVKRFRVGRALCDEMALMGDGGGPVRLISCCDVVGVFR